MATSVLDRQIESFFAKLQERDLVGAWSAKMAEELKAPAFQRDPEFVRWLLPYMELMSRYFDGEVRGLGRVPRGERVLLVGNHSGGTLTPDTTVFMAAWFRERGVEEPLTLLALDALFAIPRFNTLIRKLGLVPASEGNADQAVADGKTLMVYPGGAYEAFRPFGERNRIDFQGRKGFIRLALRRGLKVVPVVGHGGHETTVVLSRGDRLVELMGMRRMRVDVCPVVLQIPWGVSSPMFPGLPLPAKITVEACEPLDWSSYGPEGAEDPAVLRRCYDEITGVMQAKLAALAAERPRPLLERLRGVIPS